MGENFKRRGDQEFDPGRSGLKREIDSSRQFVVILISMSQILGFDDYTSRMIREQDGGL